LRAAELVGLKLTDIDDDSLTVNQSVWHGKAQSPKTDTAMRTLALSWQLVSWIDALRVPQACGSAPAVSSPRRTTPGS
jgi:hypothetical protein